MPRSDRPTHEGVFLVSIWTGEQGDVWARVQAGFDQAAPVIETVAPVSEVVSLLTRWLAGMSADGDGG